MLNCTHGTDHCWKRTRCQYLSSMATYSYNPLLGNLNCTITAERFWYSQLMLKVGVYEKKIVLLVKWPWDYCLLWKATSKEQAIPA